MDSAGRQSDSAARTAMKYNGMIVGQINELTRSASAYVRFVEGLDDPLPFESGIDNTQENISLAVKRLTCLRERLLNTMTKKTTGSIRAGYERLTRPRWMKIASYLLIAIGLVTILRAALLDPVQYAVLLETADFTSSHHPPAYLVERRWWGFSVRDYPLRFDAGAGWEYQKEGHWRSLMHSSIADQIDVRWIHEDPGDNREDDW